MWFLRRWNIFTSRAVPGPVWSQFDEVGSILGLSGSELPVFTWYCVPKCCYGISWASHFIGLLSGWSLPNPPLTCCGITWHTYDHPMNIFPKITYVRHGSYPCILSTQTDFLRTITYEQIFTSRRVMIGRKTPSRPSRWPQSHLGSSRGRPRLGLHVYSTSPNSFGTRCVTDKNHQMWVFSAWSRRGSRVVGGGIFFRSLRTLRQLIGHCHIYIYIYIYV